VPVSANDWGVSARNFVGGIQSPFLASIRCYRGEPAYAGNQSRLRVDCAPVLPAT
jgi:hypothetical protein